MSDRFARIAFTVVGWLAVLVLVGVLLVLAVRGARAFQTISLGSFLFGTLWRPDGYHAAEFGIVGMVVSTGLVTLGSMVLAIPIGVGCAAFLAEYAPESVKSVLKPTVELLAALPSVVVGFVGLVWLGPTLAHLTGTNHGLNALNGSFLLALMALPTIISVSEDAFSSVSGGLRAASSALGAGKFTTLVRIVLPAARSGVVAAIVLGVGRSVGETMTVLMATGNAIAMPMGFTDSIRTLTATIAIELGEVPHDSPHEYALFAVGLVLFLITLVVNGLAEWLVRRGPRHVA